MNDVSTMQVTKSLAMSSVPCGGLICIRGTHLGQMIPLPSDKPVTIGRDATVCQYTLNDIQVSRRHCSITYIASLRKYLIIDYSSNGTFVEKGKRLQKGKEYYLSPLTEICIGNQDNIYKLR